MMTKTFEFKGQAINYYNKVKANNKIDTCIVMITKGGWTVFYNYKK